MTPPFSSRFRSLAWPILLIALTALAAYHNTFSVPPVLDDVDGIVQNQTIRDLSAWREVLRPPLNTTPSGRPVLNLSLAINYAISGTEVWSYHILNLLIHIAAGLALFGCVRRTLQLPSLRTRFGTDATLIALGAALLWTLHPLQTESVTYLIQRAESLMGLFYLLTVYCYLRSVDSPTPRRWQLLAVVVCALGMATKEVMATAPLLVLLHDRAFAGGSFRAAWRQRGRLHVGLALTWIVVGCMVASTGGNRSGAVGFGTGVSWLSYFLTQFVAVATYLKLALWPHPLVFEYGIFYIKHARQLILPLLVVVPLAGATLYALWRRPGLGFLGGWFFGILSVTSLMPGTTQMIVEHRVYLSLAAIMVGVVLAGHAWLGRRSWLPVAALALLFGAVTERRNHDYRSPLALWTDTVAKRIENVAALSNIGQRLIKEGKPGEAFPYYEAALRFEPGMARVHAQYGLALGRSGRMDEAFAHLQEALRLDPTLPEAHFNFGSILSRAGRYDEAIAQFDEVLRLQPDSAEARNEMGITLGRAGRLDAAIACFEQVLQADPRNTSALTNLGFALTLQGHQAEARAKFEEALRVNPNLPDARANLDRLLAEPAPASRP